MRRIFVFVALIVFPILVLAQGCDVPAFEEFARSNARESSENLPLAIDMRPIAQLRIPSGFSRIGVLPSGSIGLGQHPKGWSVLLGFETTESISIHKKGVKPAQFLRSIFKGLDSDGCKYLQSYQLESQDYRLHAEFENGAELFAYGKGAPSVLFDSAGQTQLGFDGIV